MNTEDPSILLHNLKSYANQMKSVPLDIRHFAINPKMTIDEKANAIRTMVVGALIADYGARLIVDGTTHELKQLINAVLKSVNRVEQHFLHHPNTDTKYREVFKREFLSNNIVLIAELIQTVWSYSEDSLEEIIKAIKANVETEQNK